ncbi:type IV pilin-like G/H family protein [Geitlerinema sp. PCC 9228]|uniref:type IV pilin-like G/H family protein n=1 Tax=Geitlerinema sp. PCC 9228 TaxID=111611 RepID=UPI0008F9D8F5|nr:type IV pilin-like G/H family protein [Geitlerinema sp. PCC 9228]
MVKRFLSSTAVTLSTLILFGCTPETSRQQLEIQQKFASPTNNQELQIENWYRQEELYINSRSENRLSPAEMDTWVAVEVTGTNTSQTDTSSLAGEYLLQDAQGRQYQPYESDTIEQFRQERRFQAIDADIEPGNSASSVLLFQTPQDAQEFWLQWGEHTIYLGCTQKAQECAGLQGETSPHPLMKIPPTAVELRAKNILDVTNRIQQSYRLKNDRFAESWEDLQLDLERFSRGKFYDYQIEKADKNVAIATAKAKYPDRLKSFTSVIYLNDSNNSITADLCRTETVSGTPPTPEIADSGQIDCTGGLVEYPAKLSAIERHKNYGVILMYRNEDSIREQATRLKDRLGDQGFRVLQFEAVSEPKRLYAYDRKPGNAYLSFDTSVPDGIRESVSQNVLEFLPNIIIDEVEKARNNYFLIWLL